MQRLADVLFLSVTLITLHRFLLLGNICMAPYVKCPIHCVSFMFRQSDKREILYTSFLSSTKHPIFVFRLIRSFILSFIHSFVSSLSHFLVHSISATLTPSFIPHFLSLFIQTVIDSPSQYVNRFLILSIFHLVSK